MKLLKIIIVVFLSISFLKSAAQLYNNDSCTLTASKYVGCYSDQFELRLDPSCPFVMIMWTFGDGDSSNQRTNRISHTYGKIGVLKACVKTYDKHGQIINYKCITITILDDPNPIIGLSTPSKQLLKGNLFEFTDNSVPGNNLAPIVHRYWDFGDSIYDSIVNPVHSYQKSGAYEVLLTVFDANSCYFTTSKQVKVFDSVISISENAEAAKFIVCPNPFTESVNVSFPQNKVITDIELLDLSGKSINFRGNIRTDKLEIFRDDLPTGIYILKIVSDKVYVFKLMAE